jgi:hypothetical protein
MVVALTAFDWLRIGTLCWPFVSFFTIMRRTRRTRIPWTGARRHFSLYRCRAAGGTGTALLYLSVCLSIVVSSFLVCRDTIYKSVNS